VSNILIPEDPAFQRWPQLIDAMGNGPTMTAFENAAAARIVVCASPDDCAALTRLVRKARRDAFHLGRLNARAEGEGGNE
jgi:hypothetical protein